VDHIEYHNSVDLPCSLEVARIITDPGYSRIYVERALINVDKIKSCQQMIYFFVYYTPGLFGSPTIAWLTLCFPFLHIFLPEEQIFLGFCGEPWS
jgi:hypothetical protein